MRKFIALSLLSAGIIFFAGCDIQKNEQSRPVADEDIFEQNDAVQTITYENSDYGFSLDLPQTWENFTVSSRALDWRTFGTSDSVDFGLNGQDSLFNISVHTKDQWAEITDADGPMPTYLGESDEYVFAYSSSQDADEINLPRMEEIAGIVGTFALSK